MAEGDTIYAEQVTKKWSLLHVRSHVESISYTYDASTTTKMRWMVMPGVLAIKARILTGKKSFGCAVYFLFVFRLAEFTIL
jgi:hypothetical protein